MDREALQQQIASLRRRASSLRRAAAYADSRAAREEDLNNAARLDSKARELELQLDQLNQQEG